MIKYLYKLIYTTTTRKPIIISENHLEWKMIKGGGPGGQSVNKTSSCVQLTHLPTGIVIKCQQSRDATTNKHYAYKMLKAKLDVMINGDLSLVKQEQEKKRQQKLRRQRRSEKKYHQQEEQPSSNNNNNFE